MKSERMSGNKNTIAQFQKLIKKQPEHEGESEKARLKYVINENPYSVITRPPYYEKPSFGGLLWDCPKRWKRRW